MSSKGLARVVAGFFVILLIWLSSWAVTSQNTSGTADPAQDAATQMFEQGRQTFRFDTFGDEVFWGDTLKLHQAIAGKANGGVGPGLSPKMALQLGLKVDTAALPADLVSQVKAGKVNLDDPATTLALLKLNAVVGVTGFFDGSGKLTSVGIQCALCHSTVDDSFAPGIGARRDGWPNRDLNVGAIVALAPDLSVFEKLLNVDNATVLKVLNSWGPGKFDAELNLDGKALRPDGGSAATLLPAAFGLAGVNLHTYTGWGSVTYWNAYVANLEMHGQGNFYDPRLNNPNKYPIAAANKFYDVRHTPDLITPKLAALQYYQLSLTAPKPPAGSFDPAAAARGEALFDGKAACARCHVPPLYVEPGWPMHTAQEMGIDDFQASRSPDGMYRTTPLAGLWTHQKGGFYHDGRFATLEDVIQHYNTLFNLSLTDAEVGDLKQYLLSLPDENTPTGQAGTGVTGAESTSEATIEATSAVTSPTNVPATAAPPTAQATVETTSEATSEPTGEPTSEVTPEPTVETTLEVTAEGRFGAGATCVVAAGNAEVNLRQAASTTAAQAGTLAAGTTVEIVGQVVGADGMVWWQTAERLWVRSDVVTVQQGDCTAVPTVKTGG